MKNTINSFVKVVKIMVFFIIAPFVFIYGAATGFVEGFIHGLKSSN